jgi:tRNA 2-selenouridine synthase SelU
MKKQKRPKMIEGLNSSPLKRKSARLVEDPGEDVGSKSVPAARAILDKPPASQRVHDDLLSRLERLKQEISELEYEARRSEKPQQFPSPSDEYLANLRYGKTTAVSLGQH